MNVEQLSIKENLLVAERAEQLWQDRLHALDARLRPVDPALADTLSDLRHDEQQHGSELASMDATLPMPRVWHLDEPTLMATLQEHFPSLTSAARPKATRRDVLQLVEAVEAECIRFYRKAAAAAPTKSAREFFLHMAAQEEGHRQQVPTCANDPAGV